MFKLSRVSAGYGKVEVLRDINMEIAEGKTVCLIGPNGAGKTTLLKAISGFLNISEGRILFKGEEISRLSPDKIVALGIVQAPENRRLFQGLTVTENLKAGAYLSRNRTRRDKIRVAKDFDLIYEYFPVLYERGNQFAGTLSGGQQQMLALGRALMARPKLLILDEPSFGLAPLIVNKIYDVIRKLKNEGATIFLVEQNVKKALITSDFGYILNTGAIVSSGSNHDLMESNEIQEHYLGKNDASNKKMEVIN
ncbi:MAG: ABC transporter ATP-binding protein [Deltaproteobacteria bacterium]|nr:ABC transporter ATP-binding protein [Deltaproteobacteria bacterium]MBT4644493.1 ABC transporter ATP-binding protein [Deltaproteobacteria bacterium]MBT6500499.1 ABC transporter ATP-binding protein [Deltaproteobacteria bacterium]MBT6615663.1 ABC transporter ATP-binding protein [Deltaproteobacteria bacterium]MBT7711724.1 ABC transporter ATP-binding protein [Deltaproteobacteria bacterium]